MKTFNAVKFCKDLFALRGSYTQEEFSKNLEINRSTLSLLESGKQVPSFDILSKICNLGNCTPNDYFVDVENDSLLYLMGTMDPSDKDKIDIVMDRIQIKEKYKLLSRRCSS